MCDECNTKTKDKDERFWAGRLRPICPTCKDAQNKKWLKYAVPKEPGLFAHPPATAIDLAKSHMWIR